MRSEFHDGYVAVGGDSVDCFARGEAGESAALLLVGKNNVDVILYKVGEIFSVGFYYVVARHVEAYLYSAAAGKLCGALHERMILHEVAFEVEVLAAFEHLVAEFGGGKFGRRTEAGCKCALPVGRNECRGYAGACVRMQKVCFRSSLTAYCFVKFPVFVIAYFTYERGSVSQACERYYGVCRRTARGQTRIERVYAFAYFCVSVLIDKLH